MDKSEDRPMSRNILRTLLFLMIGGLGGICVYAFQAPNVTTFFSIVGVGTLIAGASLLGGGTLGFLFGIPRTNLLGDQERYTPNTNIEQISDWLTKIIVGVGLTQITKVPAALEGLSVKLAPALGGFASSPVFSIAIVLYFLLCGFLYGWLWTRLYLTIAIKESENPDKLAKESAGLYTIEDGLPEEAKGKIQEQRLKVEEQLATLIPDTRKAQQQLIQFAQEYERIRDTMPFGSERTSRMSALVAQVRALAARADYKPDFIISLFNTGKPGDRIVALGLTQARPTPDLFDIVVKAISPKLSSFEQYNALRIAEDMLPRLIPDQKEQLISAIETERKSGNIPPNSDRDIISQRIINKIKNQ